MSTALIRKDESGLALSDVMKLGDVFKASGYFQDVRDQAQAVVKVLYGQELGFSPVVSMLGVHVIEGKPALSSNLMAALIKRSGKYNFKVRKGHWTNTECIIDFFEKVAGEWEELGEASFTIEDAKTAQVRFQGARGPSGWTKFPKAMLFARALSQGLRAHCPDVSIAPLYVPEELGANVNEEGEVITAKTHQVVDLDESPIPPAPVKPISFKKQDSAAINKDQGGATCQEGEKPSDAADTHSAAGGVTATASVISPDRPAVEYISVKEQKDFHAACRLAYSPDPNDEKRRSKADGLTYQWLMDNHYINSKGEPSGKMIPAKDWPSAMEKACKWLRVQ